MKKQVLLFLMTKKGLETLKVLVDNNRTDQVGLVVIGLDKGQYDFSAEIKDMCVKNKINYCYRTDNFLNDKFDYALAVGWRWMIKEVNNLIVLHDSLLPKYRGFSPLVNALLNKEKKVGVTALWASEKYDEGDIIIQRSIEIQYPIKINKAIAIIAKVYKNVVADLFKMIDTNENLPAISQKKEAATYSLWRDEEDYHIDWTKSSDEILTLVNALGSPYKGAYCFIENRKVRVLEVEPIEDVVLENRNCGKVLFVDKDIPFVVCGSGILKILKAFYEDTGDSVVPLKMFRTRFK